METIDNVLQENIDIEIVPPVIYFAGCSLGRVHRQKMQILNKSAFRQRIQLSIPASSELTLTYKKKGWIAPGHCQEVVVSYSPQNSSQFRDNIGIFSVFDVAPEKWNELRASCPIIVCPHAIRFEFPIRVDMGPCKLKDTITRSILLDFDGLSRSSTEPTSNEVVATKPDFKTVISSHHPFFNLQSDSSSSSCIISYTPLSLGTHFIEFSVQLTNIPESSKTCRVYASSVIECKESNMLDPSQTNIPNFNHITDHMMSVMTQTMADGDHVVFGRRCKTKDTIMSEIIDTTSNLLSTEETKSDMTQSTRRRKKKKSTKPNIEIDATSDDTQKIIDEGFDWGVASLDFIHSISKGSLKSVPSAKMIADDLHNKEKALEISTFRMDRIGSDVHVMLSDETELKCIQAEIEKHAVDEKNARIDVEMKRRNTVKKSLDDLEPGERPGDEIFAYKAICTASFPNGEPDFDISRNNSWSRRSCALRRFVDAATKIIVRLRVDSRLKKVQKFLADAQDPEADSKCDENVERLIRCQTGVLPYIPSSSSSLDSNQPSEIDFAAINVILDSKIQVVCEEEKLDDICGCDIRIKGLTTLPPASDIHGPVCSITGCVDSIMKSELASIWPGASNDDDDDSSLRLMSPDDNLLLFPQCNPLDAVEEPSAVSNHLDKSEILSKLMSNESMPFCPTLTNMTIESMNESMRGLPTVYPKNSKYRKITIMNYNNPVGEANMEYVARKQKILCPTPHLLLANRYNTSFCDNNSQVIEADPNFDNFRHFWNHSILSGKDNSDNPLLYPYDTKSHFESGKPLAPCHTADRLAYHGLSVSGAMEPSKKHYAHALSALGQQVEYVSDSDDDDDGKEEKRELQTEVQSISTSIELDNKETPMQKEVIEHYERLQANMRSRIDEYEKKIRQCNEYIDDPSKRLNLAKMPWDGEEP